MDAEEGAELVWTACKKFPGQARKELTLHWPEPGLVGPTSVHGGGHVVFLCCHSEEVRLARTRTVSTEENQAKCPVA